MYTVDAFAEIRASNLIARIPSGQRDLANVIEQMVDIDTTERGKYVFTCRRLLNRMVPDALSDLDRPIEVRDGELYQRVDRLVQLGILRYVTGPGQIDQGGDWVPVFELADS